MEQLRPRYDRDGNVFIECPECRAPRYVREGPQTECSKCGTWITFYYERGL